MRALVLVVLALVAGCDDDAATSGAPDLAAPDLAAGGCSRAPSCAGHTSDFECTDGDMVCGCHSNAAFCHSTACPDVTFGESADGSPCTMPGLVCDYGFENQLDCVGPENRWVFSGGSTLCESATTGALCGGPPGQCPQSHECVCGDDQHVHCANGDGGV
ncbi:MAG TPA: hypothetical protein VN947_17670 [Polyangia bacterium]|nr:hypothetical protein [Polyangia bacterium]